MEKCEICKGHRLVAITRTLPAASEWWRGGVTFPANVVYHYEPCPACSGPASEVDDGEV